MNYRQKMNTKWPTPKEELYSNKAAWDKAPDESNSYTLKADKEVFKTTCRKYVTDKITKEFGPTLLPYQKEDRILAAMEHIASYIDQYLPVSGIQGSYPALNYGAPPVITDRDLPENPDPRDTIRKFCDDLKEKMLAKFEAGAKEHPGHWSQVDCWKEVQLEIIDCCNYICMEKTK